MIRLILLTFPAFILYSCENGFWNCLRGNGIPAEETREPAYFNGIVSEGAFDVLVIPDSVYAVKIEADQNIIPYVRTRVSNNRLIIDTGTRKCLRSESPMLLTVRVPVVNFMSLTGSGQITGDDLSSDEMRVEITGSGRIDLRGLDVGFLDALITGSGEMIFWGTAENADIDISGSGNIDAFQLAADECIASISGSGSIYITVDSRLDAFISGSGNIFYKGTPVVFATITGSGKVINSNK